MSTKVSGGCDAKKMSSCVRPGVWEVRARALRPVRALIRLDLPTFERPASATSIPSAGGRTGSDPAAATKSHRPAKSRRPASTMSAGAGSSVIASALRLRRLGLQSQHALEIVPQLDLHAVAAHDEAL